MTFKDLEGQIRSIFIEILRLIEEEKVLEDDILFSLGLEKLEKELRESETPLSLGEIFAKIIDKIAEEKNLPEEKRKELTTRLQNVTNLQNVLEELGKEEFFQETGLRADRILNIGGVVYIPDDYEIIAVTDLHGDIEMLERAIMKFKEKKQSNPKVAFVVMGDFVDRGKYCGEVILRLLELKRRYQEEVVIIVGDHERDFTEDSPPKGTTTYLPNFDPSEFWNRCSKSPFSEIKEQIFKLFLNLPHLVVVDKNTIITHGGLPDGVDNIGHLMYVPKKALSYLEYPEENKSIPIPMHEKLGKGRQWVNLLRVILWGDLHPSPLLGSGLQQWLDRPPITPEQFKKAARNLLGLTGKPFIPVIIRGHQYDILPQDGNAYNRQNLIAAGGVLICSIITFHSNQSYYAEDRKAYKNAVILEIKKVDDKFEIKDIGYDQLAQSAQKYKEILNKLNQQIQSEIPKSLRGLSPMFSLLARTLAMMYGEKARGILSGIIGTIKECFEQKKFPQETLSQILDAVYSARNPELMLDMINSFIDDFQKEIREISVKLLEQRKLTEEDKKKLLSELLPYLLFDPQGQYNLVTILVQNLDALRKACNETDKKGLEKNKVISELIHKPISQAAKQLEEVIEGFIKGEEGVPEGEEGVPKEAPTEGKKVEIPPDLTIENLKTLESQVLDKCVEGIIRARELLKRLYSLKLPRSLMKILSMKELSMKDKKKRKDYIKNIKDPLEGKLLQKIIEIEEQIYDVFKEITEINTRLIGLKAKREKLESSKKQLKKIKKKIEKLYKELIVLNELAEKHLKTIEVLEQTVKKLEDTYGTNYKPPSSAERRKTLENFKQILAVGGWVILLSVILWPVYLGIYFPLNLIEKTQELLEKKR